MWRRLFYFPICQSIYQVFEQIFCMNIRLLFVDTLFIVRSRPNTSMQCAVIINYFLVHKIVLENLTFSTQILLKSTWHNPDSKKAQN